MRTRCQLCQRLRGHGVGVVNNYANTDKTTRTLLENFEGFSQILKEQSGEKRYLGVFTNPIAIFKNMKTSDQISSRKQKVRKTVFACSYGAQVESFNKKMVENLATLSL